MRYLIKCSIVLAKCARLQIMYVYLGFVGGMGGGAKGSTLGPCLESSGPQSPDHLCLSYLQTLATLMDLVPVFAIVLLFDFFLNTSNVQIF